MMGANYSHVAAMAGAGCGKTYSLVENYLAAVLGFDASLSKKRPQEILALTFTEKAASEMRLRITKRLQEIIFAHHDDDPLIAMANAAGRSMPSTDELQKILRALPTATISTFHSFCSQLLRKEAAACGIDERFSILSPKDELFMARNILRPIIIDALEKNNRAVKSLVARMGLSPNLASLGLLDGLMAVYLKLFEKNIESEHLLSLTSGAPITVEDLSAAFHEIEIDLAKFVAIKATDKTRARLDHVATAVHDLSRALESKHEGSIARAHTRLRKAAGGNFGDHEARKNLVASIENLGNRLIDFMVHDEEKAAAEFLHQFHHAFSAHTADAMAMSYSDLLLKAKDALKNDLILRQRVKQRIKHILVDEYQDTSPIQQDIIALLAEDRNIAHKVSAQKPAIDAISFRNGPSLFVVGDKKQSIYGFRGASVALFDRMIEKMQETHLSTDHFSKRLLVTNRRSDRAVIDMVNLVSRHSLHAQGYEIDQQLLAMPDIGAGRAGLFVLDDDEERDKTSANCHAASFGIAQLLVDNSDRKASDIVVLVRRIKTASVIKRILLSLGINARIVGGDGFFQQQEIADVLSALKLINDPGHHLACGVLMRSPLVLLTDDEILGAAIDHEQGLTLPALSSRCEKNLLSDGSKKRLQTFIAALEQAKLAIDRDGLAAALDVIIDHCDAAYAYGLHENHAQKWANIEKLRTMLLFKTGNPYSVIDDLYDELSKESKEPQAQTLSDDDAVTIMTIHQSKGLEFKVVVVADGEGMPITNLGDFLVSETKGLALKARGRPIASCSASSDNELVVPTRYDEVRGEQKQREDDEVARLLYVALTRARTEIYVASSRASFTAKTLPHNVLGLFLRAQREVPEEFSALCEIIALKKPEALEHKAKAVVLPAINLAAPQHEKISRYFASALPIGEDNDIATLIKRPLPSLFGTIDGDGAHRLLSWLCPLMRREMPDYVIDHLIDSALRSEGMSFGDKEKATIAAVKQSAITLLIELRDQERIITELPLSFMATPSVMIEGFADLVVERDNFIGVAEFKSGYQRVVDKISYAQVLAYAEALSQQTNKSVHYAVVLVGSKTWQWQPYDVRARQIFLRAINNIG